MRIGKLAIICARPTRVQSRVTSIRFTGRILVPVLLLILASLPSAVRGQEVDSTVVARFQLAESFIRAAQFTRAIPLLEDLYDQKPETYVFYERLRQAYENVKRYDDAISLVDHKIETDANPAIYLSDKARLYYLKGNDVDARRIWRDALDSMDGSSSIYLLVYRSVMEVRLFDFAIEILETGRKELSNTMLFQTDLAQLYSLTSQHDKAIDEYLNLLTVNSGQLAYVRSRLQPYASESDARSLMTFEVEKAIAENPLVRPYRELLSWLYLEGDRYSDALNVNRAIDRLENENGVVLFSFAQTAANAEAFQVAAEAFQEVLDRYPASPTAPEALRGLGVMQEAWAESEPGDIGPSSVDADRDSRYLASLGTYRRFIKLYPQNPYFPDVLRRMGRLQQDIFFQLDDAMQILSRVVRQYPNSTTANEASFDIGRILVMKNDLSAAQIEFTRLITRLRTGETANKARLELARLQYYRGQFESASSEVTALQENTSTDVANDAIELRLLIMENRGPDSLDSALNLYAKAELSIRQHDIDRAFSLLHQLLQVNGAHPLADNARFMRAILLKNSGQDTDAIQAFLEIPLIHPDSFLNDQALLEAADLQRYRFDDPAVAISTLTRILTDYPGSLLIPQVRERIRMLRGDGV